MSDIIETLLLGNLEEVFGSEVKSVGNGSPIAYAVKAGPWIFLNNHEAFATSRRR